jgi:hypothetical protein
VFTLQQVLLGGLIKENGMGGACSAHGEIRNSYKVLVGKHEGRRPLGRPRRKWEDNIREMVFWVWIGFI